MDQIEAKHPVTSLDTVSCRTDLLDWYQRRGYRRVSQIPIDQVAKFICIRIVCMINEIFQCDWYRKENMNRHDLTFIKLIRNSQDESK